MDLPARLRRPRPPARLRLSRVLGAAYAAGFAVLMTAAPRPTARLLRLPLPPLPEGAFYLWIMAVLLLMLAALYLLAARDPGRNGGIVAGGAARPPPRRPGPPPAPPRPPGPARRPPPPRPPPPAPRARL